MRLASFLVFAHVSLILSANDSVQPVQFSVERAFCDAPFFLELSTQTPGARIYYSVDGGEPGLLYVEPIAISGTSVIRARAFKDGQPRSRITTRTYLFLDDVIRQAPDGEAPAHFPASWGRNAVDYGMDPNVVSRYTLAEWREALTQVPSISIVTEMKHLFDPDTGIYANAHGHGREWERPASIELLDSSATTQRQFQEDCGLRIRGGYSRNPQYAKHSFRVFFRREYGSGRLRYPLFDKDGADEFDTIDLRTSQNYAWAIDSQNGHHDTMLRDEFARDTLAALGQPATRSRYYHLYLNGQYWGLYETEERPEASYGEIYFGGRKEEYDTVKSANHNGGFVTEATDGTLEAFRILWSMARKVAAEPSHANYFAVIGRNADGTRNSVWPVMVDVDNLIDYMLVIFYTGDGDAPLSSFGNNELSNNWFGLRNRNDPETGFRFFNHDAEHTLGAPNSRVDRTGPFLSARQNDFLWANPQWIHQDLSANSEYRLRFADHVQRHCFGAGALTPAASLDRFQRRVAQIDKAIRAYSARWGDTVREPPYGEAEWRSTVNQIVQHWFPSRTAILIEQLKQDGLYPAVATPILDPPGGSIAAGTLLNLVNPNGRGTVYLSVDGTDPRLVGGPVSSRARPWTEPIPVTRRMRVAARVRIGEQWSALVEANYLPVGLTQDRDADGLPNDWEMAHRLNPDDPSDAGLDADFDGHSNREEFLAGTDPGDRSSVLRLIVRSRSTGYELSFLAKAGLSYAVEFSDPLAPETWRTLTRIPAKGTSGGTVILDGQRLWQRFYRIRVE